MKQKLLFASIWIGHFSFFFFMNIFPYLPLCTSISLNTCAYSTCFQFLKKAFLSCGKKSSFLKSPSQDAFKLAWVAFFKKNVALSNKDYICFFFPVTHLSIALQICWLLLLRDLKMPYGMSPPWSFPLGSNWSTRSQRCCWYWKDGCIAKEYIHIHLPW